MSDRSFAKLAVLSVFGASMLGASCPKTDARTVLDRTEQACVNAAPLTMTVEEVRVFCRIVDVAIPVLEEVLSAKHAGARLHAGSPCAPPSSSVR